MARTLRDAKLDTSSARKRLKRRKEPYWRSISPGLAIGYRRLADGGTWIARHYTTADGRRYRALGTADDVVDDSQGKDVLTFAQAQERAREWFRELATGAKSGPLTVRQAGKAYVDFLRAERKTADDTEHRLKKWVYPKLGERPIAALKTDELEKWKRGLVRKDDQDPDAERRSKDSANRVLTMLKALLNRAFKNDHATSDVQWRRVKPFEKVGRARQVHLDGGQAKRLINTSEGAFRNLVIAALLTGARPPHELVACKVGDFSADTGTLSVNGKTGAREIVLTKEAVRWFQEITAGKDPDALLLPKDDGTPWGKNHHIRPMCNAVKKAKLPTKCTIYSLRHTYASQSILAGMNLKLLAENMGTSIRMLEVHYAKFIAASRRQLVEETAFRLNLPAGNVASIA